MKKILLFHLLLACPVVFVVWYVVFPNTIWFMEGNAFFSTAPDFTALQLSLPADWMKYAGVYLLQFFYFRMGGALIQTLFVAIVLLSSDCVLACLLRNKRLLWLSFIPVVWFISGQFADMTLVRSIGWCTVLVTLAVLVWLFTLKRGKWNPSERGFLCSPFFSYLVPCLLLAGGIFYQVTDKEQKEAEEIFRIDHWADDKNWNAILQEVTPEVARQSQLKLRWALLALSETGRLAEKVFAYGVSDPSCFYYERQDQQFYHCFNMQFYDALGLDNEVIHHAFQAGIEAPNGMNFRSMRRIMAANRRLGNDRILAKYTSVISRSSCYNRWKEPISEPTADRADGDQNICSFFIGARPFLSDMARLMDCHLDSRKVRDYLLCGLLISKDIEKFYQVFGMIYQPSQGQLPRYYEEALVVAATKYPDVLQYYAVSREKVTEFKAFQTLLNGSMADKRMLEVKYRDSFWFWLYCMQKV
ncbi:DUF6057 family protein [Bacteroides helcogenes]|uniref:Transmembrane protein n=1 Tax=Bacteroides helcogenes (strain ATCC 35417 / DSM 20613 / JCM 6297 / CCUG 15421 / P 36-108) TaxID=693979 RepID=E6SWN3_BACT6|nr:DUF6057 family protein [Bacteroides helcogenes]ADV42631.1 hypothetical protein Bache_0606 [Bacteroides helcogenes P 36-108]MDY5239462.1 DUF6057 family protein [Bacteroides helcogenes]